MIGILTDRNVCLEKRDIYLVQEIDGILRQLVNQKRIGNFISEKKTHNNRQQLDLQAKRRRFLALLFFIQEDQVHSLSTVTKASQQATETIQQAKDLFNLLQEKLTILDQIRYRLTNVTIDSNNKFSLL